MIRVHYGAFDVVVEHVVVLRFVVGHVGHVGKRVWITVLTSDIAIVDYSIMKEKKWMQPLDSPALSSNKGMV